MTTLADDTNERLDKSTIVRSTYAAPHWIETGFSAASQLAPGLTARLVERLFRKTERRSARPGEREVLQGARPMTLGGMKAWCWGEGPTVLLVHGWNGRATQLGAFVSPLSARGYRVVAFDALGHGESPGNYLSLPELATCIHEVADELGAVHGVVAHSLGGAATTLALAKGLQLERAVFISPPADPRVFLASFSAALGISDEVRTLVQRRLEERLGAAMEDMRATALAPAMRTPLLVIHDRDDKEVPARAGQSIAEAWPNAELMLTEGLGHQRILRDESVTHFAVRFIDAPMHRQAAA
jgi:pimeloyl-ACP methyl ester carboxylesterase